MRVKILCLLLSVACLMGGAAARGDLAFTLTPADQSGADTNEIIFTGTLSNTDATNCLFLNDLQICLLNDATNFLSLDTNEFFANVPGILLPGETYSGEIFGIILDPLTSPDDYFGSVTLLGGTNIFASNGLPSVTFHISWPDSVGDGIPDWWRAQYFGGDGASTNDQSCAACDADGTGQNNFFKYIAGLDPTNAASLFTLGISLPAQPNLTFGPTAPGRIYNVQFETDPTSSLWTSLAPASPITTTNLLSITDTNAPGNQRFYRVEISLP